MESVARGETSTEGAGPPFNHGAALIGDLAAHGGSLGEQGAQTDKNGKEPTNDHCSYFTNWNMNRG
jgi:hypothetical protein